MSRPSSNQSFHGGLNVAFINARYNIFQIQHIPTSPNTFLAFFLPAIPKFLELKYQGMAFSPFQSHHETMHIALFSLLLYCFACDFETRLSSPAYAQVVRGGKVVFGSLLSVSLASVLFENSVWLALFFVYIGFSNREILSCKIKLIYNWLRRRENRGNLLPV